MRVLYRKFHLDLNIGRRDLRMLRFFLKFGFLELFPR